jgi:hypothetical protein
MEEDTQILIKSLKVSVRTWKRLSQIKIDKNLTSIDDVIDMLLTLSKAKR